MWLWALHMCSTVSCAKDLTRSAREENHVAFSQDGLFVSFPYTGINHTLSTIAIATLRVSANSQ